MTLEFGKSSKTDNFTILIWGADGVGKTPTVMHLAKHAGPAAIVDADGGLAPYLNGQGGVVRIRYAGERIHRKAGKTAAGAGGAKK